MKTKKLSWQQKKQVKKTKQYCSRLKIISKYLVNVFDSDDEDFFKKASANSAAWVLDEAISEVLKGDFLLVSDRFYFLIEVSIARCRQHPGLGDFVFLIEEIFNELSPPSYQLNLFDWDKFAPSY